MRLRWAVVATTLTAAISFGAVAPPERCPDVTAADLRRAAASAVAWFEGNQRGDGTWLYQYDRDRRAALADYNVVRHAGVLMSLYQAADAGSDDALAVADRGLQWALVRVDRDGERAALDTDGQRPVGASALLVAALVGRRAVTGDVAHDALLRRLGRFLVDQTEPTGAVIAYGDPAPGAPLRSKYYTGEAFWALALLARTFPDDGAWRASAARIGRYLATERDDAEDHWPPIPDHWAAYGMAELATTPGADPPGPDVVAYARRQAELFGLQVRTVAQRFGPWGRLVRGTWVPRGGGYGVVGEALGQLWRLSAATPALGDVRDAIAVRDECIAGLAVDAQTTVADDPRARGAWFRDGETRMDDQQHALSALLHALPVVAADHGDDEPRPSPWLWALALVALADPARLARAPRNWVIGRRISGRSPDLAVAGAAVVAVTAVLAGLSGPVLDVVDVSAPSARLAAAAVMAVVGVVHLVRRPPLHLGVVAAPVVVVAAGADAGALVVALAAIVAATTASALPAAPIMRWVSRGTAAALLATAILLGVDGVLAV